MPYNQWVADGKPFTMATPLANLRKVLGDHGYTGPATGYPDQAHLTAQPPEDHTPFSATGWPQPSPYGYCLALDIMPDSGIPDLTALAMQLIVDKDTGVSGMAWLKYINWTDYNGNTWDTSWTPNGQTTVSGDKGHIHLSCLSDRYLDDVPYSPYGQPTTGDSDMLYLVSAPGDPGVWMSNGVTRRPMSGQAEIEGWLMQGPDKVVRYENVDLAWYGIDVRTLGGSVSTGLPDHTHTPGKVAQ